MYRWNHRILFTGDNMGGSKSRYLILINGQENYTLKSGLGIRQKQPLKLCDCNDLINLMVLNDHAQEIATIQLFDTISNKIKHEWKKTNDNKYEKVM